MPQAFEIFLYVWIGVAVVTFVVLQWVTAPYGRHSSDGWGPQLPNKLGWILMEAPSLILFSTLFLIGDIEKTTPMWLFFAAWVVHYTNRSFIFPLRTKTTGKTMPILIPLSAILFNMVNAGTNGYFLGFLQHYDASWLTSPQMIIGGIVFLLGMGINIWSDEILLNLRKPGETGYKIPTGGFFKWVSCPNLMGETIEWIGFAIMTWSLPGLAFAIWTAANLIPRAQEHHKFYLKRFDNYPKERKAIIPFIL